MNLGILKNNGIYYRQRDLSKDGYYVQEDDESLVKHLHKVSFREKFKYLAFNKKPTTNISTSFINFWLYKEELKVISSSMAGDAVAVAKEVKKNYNSFRKTDYEIDNNSLTFNNQGIYETIQFDNNGNIEFSKIYTLNPYKLKYTLKYSFLDWNNL